MARIKQHRGVRIVTTKVTRYEVQDATGKKVKTFTTRPAATAWVNGYLTAVNKLQPK